ncbi:hypothetical protein D3C76_1551360 [compost metagenome]
MQPEQKDFSSNDNNGSVNYGKVVNNDVANSEYHQDTQSLTSGEKSINHSDDTGDSVISTTTVLD